MSADDTGGRDETSRAADAAVADDGSTVGSGSADPDADPEPSPPLSISDVALSYGGGEPIVEAERLEVPAGEITALIGPNGSGKSTLLKAMNAELSPDRGAVTFDGTAVEEYGTTELARRLGLLSQAHTAPESTTVRELATHGRYPHRGFFEGMREEDYRAVDRALERVGVEHLADREVGGLSGGQGQLAWLAMTLAQETEALLLDEPTTYLDLHHQLRVLDAVRELNAEHGVTVCVVLHDIGQAARFADNLIVLKDGEPYEWGPPDEVVTDDLLREVFGVVADVGFGPEGPTVTPRTAVADSDDGDDDDRTV
ncbi:ABC transporter ATP-binding protein [Halobaculum lipolyticum]|uniref:Cobalamin import ATP-binding protein BtuD n=1 Tax=Halobaculum lipolyticum TaxID=3032001 RepID=A0ABD5W5W3_9EURY|nr:ABC transporter ATP-binding protein [Halobaculum sp. DT31]